MSAQLPIPVGHGAQFCAVMLPCAHMQTSPMQPYSMHPSLGHGQGQAPAVVSPGQPCCTHAHSTPVNTITQPPNLYPSTTPGLVYTYATYPEQPVPELIYKDRNCWSLCLQIPIPSNLKNPTLTSLAYVIKYATTWDKGNSTVQADTIVTTAICPPGVTSDSTDLGIYRNKSGYGPRMVDEEKATCLSSVHAIKCNGGTAQWSHYIDNHRISPNVRITHPNTYLYLNFHVFEYPSAHTLRCLAVEVSAAWVDDAEAREKEKAAKEEEERKAKEKEEEDRKAKEEEDRKAKEEEDQKAKEEEDRKAKEEEDRKAKEEEDRKAKEEEDRKAKEEADRQAKEEEDRKAKEAAKPAIADTAVQDRIEDIGKQVGVICPQGFAWSKTAGGYICGGGGHFLSFEQLGMQG